MEDAKDGSVSVLSRSSDSKDSKGSKNTAPISTSLHAHAISKKKQKVRSSDDIQVGRSSGGSITSIAALESLELIATGEHDGKIELWDLSGTLPRKLVTVDGKTSPHGTAHHSTVSSLLWMETGPQGPEPANIMLVSGDFEGVTCTWRLEVTQVTQARDDSASRVAAFHQLSAEHEHAGAVISLVEMRFRGKRAFASGSEDRSVKFWDVTQIPQLSDTLQLPAGVCALAWLPNARSEANRHGHDQCTSEWLAIGMGVNQGSGWDSPSFWS
jgi:WD40 repeat protein